MKIKFSFEFYFRLLFVLINIFLISSNTLNAQQTLIKVNGWNAYVHVPWDYSLNPSKTYPTIIFFPGTGEVGSNASLVIANGPGAYIQQGWNGNVKVGADSVKFIVISLQPASLWPQESSINNCIQTLKGLYRIDNARLHLTGLSMGGWCSTTFVTGDPTGGPYTYASQIATVVEVEGVKPDDNQPYPNLFDNFANNNGRLLGFEQVNDGRDIQTRVNRMNSTKANSAIFVATNYSGGGHCCWEQFYGGKGVTPNNYILDGVSQNIYQWMAANPLPTGGVNQPPVSYAGSDVTNTLPANTAALNGSGTDADGSIASYAWTKTSGPSSGTIASPNSASTNVSGLSQGIYQFTLTITDNKGATANDVMQVTVNAANVIPVANAGGDAVIDLPANSVSLNGSGSDADGSIASYAWTKTSGPSSGTIASPNSASTNVSGLSQGTYQFTLTVTDNKGATANDVMQVTVNAANVIPVANAGSDAIIDLPANSVSLNGSGSDADGSIASYAWTKTSGPSSGTIASPNSASTSVSGLSLGVYQFTLTVTDNKGATANDVMQVTVNAANVIPVANAGSDAIIDLPANSVSLNGSGSDADGSIASYAWTKTSGPSSGAITSPNSASTNVSGLSQGTYQFTLIVTDNKGATATDVMQVTVNPANVIPVANAGSDAAIDLPANSVSLNGSGSDADGTIASYAWTKTSGPSSGTIASPNSASTNISGLSQGIYQFTLTITDNKGATANDVMQVTVNAANVIPVANAGSDAIIDLPANSVSLNGSGSDADGSIASYAWTKTAGPSSGTITSPNSASTNVSGLSQGIYQFTLTITDNKGATANDVMQITVNAANVIPVANAGNDAVIDLPANSVSLNGSGSDADGSIASYAWTKTSGPSSGTIASPNSASTNVSGLSQGIYQFTLTVTDNKATTAYDVILVTVNAANVVPVANAGSDVAIDLPVNSVSLNGSGSDVDGSVATYAWTKTSGPSSGTIASPSAAATNITGLSQGVYAFTLTVTDNKGAVANDVLQIIVNAANVAPVANAGSDITIDLPTNSVSLNGSGSDADGSIVTYIWTQTSGPSSGTIASPNSASTDITSLSQGTYLFTLSITDNKGAIAKDTLQITVNTPNNAPYVFAGYDAEVDLPVNAVSLNGSGSDADGIVTTYTWTKTSGPTAGTITSPNTAATNITGLSEGEYAFTLKVTDNKGASAEDILIVKVNTVNTAPVANAGIDVAITKPTVSSPLSGSGTDTDGSVSSYKWKKISGRSAHIANINSAATTVSSLKTGDYKFELTVTDDEGLEAKDTMQITVHPRNYASQQVDSNFSYMGFISADSIKKKPLDNTIFDIDNFVLHNNQLTLQVNSNTQQTANIMMTDVNGIIFLKTKVSFQIGFNTFSQFVPGLYRGVFYLSVVTNKQMIVKPVLNDK